MQVSCNARTLHRGFSCATSLYRPAITKSQAVTISPSLQRCISTALFAATSVPLSTSNATCTAPHHCIYSLAPGRQPTSALTLFPHFLSNPTCTVRRALSTADSMTESLERSIPPRSRIEDLERSSLDDRSYRIVTLPNKLEALLIHDPETDKASAALDVNVGSFSDAEDMPGIAHAVEHLLFMGTEKVSSRETSLRIDICRHTAEYASSTSFRILSNCTVPSRECL